MKVYIAFDVDEWAEVKGVFDSLEKAMEWFDMSECKETRRIEVWTVNGEEEYGHDWTYSYQDKKWVERINWEEI